MEAEEIKWDELLAVAQSSLKQTTRNTVDNSARLGARVLSAGSWQEFYDLVRTKKNSYAVPLYVLISPQVMKLLFYTLRDTDLIEPTASASDVLAEVIVDYCRLIKEGRSNENNRQINSSSSDGVSEESVVEQVLSNDNRRDSEREEIGPDGGGIGGSQGIGTVDQLS
jgi:hypothetical protein